MEEPNPEEPIDPEYDYKDRIPPVLKLPRKVGKASILDAVYFIEDNISRSAGVLITGKEDCPKKKGPPKDRRVGESSYFTSGLCGPESSPECVNQPRNIIVNNLPTPKKDNEGLIPSVIGDLGSFEPVELVSSINGTGSIVNERCSMKDVEVVQLNPGSETYRRTEKLCVPDYSLNFKKPIIEDFANTSNFVSNYYNINNETSQDFFKKKWYLLFKQILFTCLILIYFVWIWLVGLDKKLKYREILALLINAVVLAILLKTYFYSS